jgi:purine nucleosidase
VAQTQILEIMSRFLSSIAAVSVAACLSAAAAPVKLILDTDISGDVDDVLALAMCHTLADRGDCELLAVTISKVNPLTGPFTDAVDTFYGRPELPVGVTRDAQRRKSRFLGVAKRSDDGQPRFPHDLLDNADAPDAVDLLRRTLAAQPDRSVVIAQVGIAVNIARLLDSEADAACPLSGTALVRRKVRLLSVMAGSFRPIDGNERYLEANVRNDIGSMQRLAGRWPDDVPVVWSGFEIGRALPYPRESGRAGT